MDGGGGFGAGLDGDRGLEVPHPRVGLASGGGGLWGLDGGALEDGDVHRVLTGLCCVAASVVAVCAAGRGARNAVGVGP